MRNQVVKVLRTVAGGKTGVGRLDARVGAGAGEMGGQARHAGSG